MKQLVLLAAIAGSVALSAGTNQWTSLGPEGGTIEYLTVDPRSPDTVYATGTSRSIFKSIDGGTHWDRTSFPAGRVVFDPQDSETLYVATWGHGLFRSTDAGASWNDTGLPDRGIVWSLVLAPQTSRTVYAAVNLRIFKSTDGGESWSTTKFKMQDYCDCGLFLTIDPQDPNTLYVGASDGAGGYDTRLYKSTDGAESWTRIPATGQLNSGQPNAGGVLVIDPRDSSTLYAVACKGSNESDESCDAWTVFKSLDAGGSWNPSNKGLPDSGGVGPVVVDPDNPSTLYAAWWDGGLFKTTDGGASWSKISPDLRVLTLAIDPQQPGTLYAGTNGGVLKSTAGGVNWSRQNSGLTATTIFGLAVDPELPGNVYAVANEEQGNTILKSMDSRASWTAMNAGLPAPGFLRWLSIDPQNTSMLFAAAWTRDSPAGVYKSTDGGVSWNAANSGLDGPLFALALDPSNPGTVYASTGINATGLGLFKTTDGAATWHYIGPGPAGLFGGLAAPVRLVIDPQEPNTMYALSISEYSQIWKSTDGAKSFTPANAGLPTFPGGGTAAVFAFAIDPVTPRTLYAWTPKFDSPPLAGGLYKSTNGGASWQLLSPGLPDGVHLNSLVPDPRSSGTLYAGTSGGVLKSSDGGAHWTSVNSGLTTLWVNDLAIDPRNPSRVYAATSGGGVFAITFAP